MRVPRKRIVELVEYVARREGVRPALVDIAVVTSGQIASMNRRYLGHGGVTDVISFDLSDETSEGLVAQIVVCGEVAVREAPLHGHGPQRELMLYVVHGLLHLTGYDDTTPRKAARMHAREEELLGEFFKVRRRRRQ